MNNKPKETLSFLSFVKGGKIKAVHRWETGAQILIFDSEEAFNRAKKNLESGEYKE